MEEPIVLTKHDEHSLVLLSTWLDDKLNDDGAKTLARLIDAYHSQKTYAEMLRCSKPIRARVVDELWKILDLRSDLQNSAKSCIASNICDMLEGIGAIDAQREVREEPEGEQEDNSNSPTEQVIGDLCKIFPYLFGHGATVGNKAIHKAVYHIRDQEDKIAKLKEEIEALDRTIVDLKERDQRIVEDNPFPQKFTEAEIDLWGIGKPRMISPDELKRKLREKGLIAASSWHGTCIHCGCDQFHILATSSEPEGIRKDLGCKNCGAIFAVAKNGKYLLLPPKPKKKYDTLAPLEFKALDDIAQGKDMEEPEKPSTPSNKELMSLIAGLQEQLDTTSDKISDLFTMQINQESRFVPNKNLEDRISELEASTANNTHNIVGIQKSVIRLVRIVDSVAKNNINP